jgi:hypothetical protein
MCVYDIGSIISTTEKRVYSELTEHLRQGASMERVGTEIDRNHVATARKRVAEVVS